MDNKDTYSPQEVADMINQYHCLRAAYDPYFIGINRSEELSTEKSAKLKDLALIALQHSLRFERNVPSNVRNLFTVELSQLERQIDKIINA